MKKLYLTVLAVFILINQSMAQSGTSNIGTEFWTAWMDHIDGAGGTTGSEMVLYIAGNVATTGTVSIADGSFTGTFSVTPGQITLFQIPTSCFLGNTDGIQTKGIHITSVAPIAVYGHIYASAVSGATLLLPVNTLANDYTSLNYTQLSNSSPSYCLFMVIGTVDNTTVQITPSAALIDGSAPGKTFTVVLNKGQVYQGISNSDLTGTHVVSVNTGAGCQKIAVFSGSNKIYIGRPNVTSDNLYQQLYPTASWGKTYITVPLKSRNYDIIRIVQSDPTGVVTLDGTALSPTVFTNGLNYDFNTTVPHVITSTKPIQVVQYAVTQSNGINGTTVTEPYGDPEMIYLNPLEQNIDNVTLYSTDRYLIKASFINVVIPTAAVSSFLLDGAAVGGFTAVPGNTAYSYAQYSVASPATHTISASQGFNAIAYGFGVAESYGYAAGTNVKNLNEYVQYNNPTTNQVSTSGCVGTPLEPQVVLPYQTTSLTWNLGNGSTPVVQTNPTPLSTFVKNGVTEYLYDYGSTVNYSAGTYAVAVTAVDPISTLCGSNDEVDLSFTVSNPPTAAFSSRDTICVTDTIGFTDHSAGNGSAISAWHYDFGDGDTSVLQNPVYTYLKPGDYTVAQTVSILTGCQSVFIKKVHVRALPVAAFAYSAANCQGQGVTLTNQSTTAEGSITQWIWNYGDGTTETRTSGTPFTHTYTAPGTYTVTLSVTTNKGCFTATPVGHSVIVNPSPVAAFGLPDVCLVNSTAQFTDKSTITDGTAAQFTYLWNFGDASATAANPNTSTLKNPVHQYITAGTYTISETVTSINGCAVTTTNTYTVSGQANFTAAATACPGDTVIFTDKTDGTNKIVSAWHWNFGTGNAADTSSLQNPLFAFKIAGNYNVTLTVSGHNGCSTTSFTKSIHINQRPTANFTFSAPTCETKTVTFTDASIANEGTLTSWLWNFGDGTTSTLQNPTHTFSPANTYTVSLTATSSLGCRSVIFSSPVIVNPSPVVVFGLPDVCLVNSTAQFTDKSTITNGTAAQFTYIWNFGDASATATNPNTSTLKNPVHQYITAGTYTITETVTSVNGCSASTTNTYTVSGQASFTAAATACPADMVMFTDKTDGTNKIVSAWHWNFGTGNPADTSSLQNPTFAFVNPGNYNVTLTVSGHNGCSTTSFTKSIHINQKPTSNFNFSAPTCATQTVTFTDASVANEGTLTSWLWNFGDGTTSTLQNPTHVFSPYSTYIVSLTTTTSVGCTSAIFSKQVIVNRLPVASFVLPDVCAADGKATFVATPDKDAISYTWFFGNTLAAITAGNVKILTGPTVVLPISTAGQYYAELTVLTAAGCTTDTIKQYTVNGAFPTAAFTVPPGTLCSSKEVDFIDGAFVPAGFDNGAVTSVNMYYNYGADQTTFTHYERPVQGQLLRHLYPTESTSPHTYTVYMIAYSGATCYSTYTATVTVQPVPAVTLTALPNLCQNSGAISLASFATTSGPAGTASFYLDASTSPISGGMFDPSVTSLGQHTITAVYTSNSTGCADTSKQTLIVAPAPGTVSAGTDQEVLLGQSVTLQGSVTGSGNFTYLWTPSTGLSNPTSLTPVASPTVDTKYTLTVTSTTSGVMCSLSDSVSVHLLRQPTAPNTFTPNGDGINDTWLVSYLDQYPGCTVKIYNRSGEMIYSSVGYAVPWDGTYRNNVLPVGTYYYIIDPKHNGINVISGSVNLIK